uniref:Uncharacterized protein n=1 Tax=Klebsiella pneumoniae TaxID=573 RepID=A0A8B0SUZ7_KLEPN|nr:hypothetical protein [Klebsiella pneumoniae]
MKYRIRAYPLKIVKKISKPNTPNTLKIERSNNDSGRHGWCHPCIKCADEKRNGCNSFFIM